VGLRVKASRVSWMLLAVAAVLAAFSFPAGSGADPLARPTVGVLAALLGVLALVLRSHPSAVRSFDIEPGDWSNSGGAYEYLIKPRKAGGRRHVVVTMPLPDGAEEEVAAHVLREPTGGIRVRAGSPVHVHVYVD
jgi:hypothetical protein